LIILTTVIDKYRSGIVVVNPNKRMVELWLGRGKILIKELICDSTFGFFIDIEYTSIINIIKS